MTEAVEMQSTQAEPHQALSPLNGHVLSTMHARQALQPYQHPMLSAAHQVIHWGLAWLKSKASDEAHLHLSLCEQARTHTQLVLQQHAPEQHQRLATFALERWLSDIGMPNSGTHSLDEGDFWHWLSTVVPKIQMDHIVLELVYVLLRVGLVGHHGQQPDGQEQLSQHTDRLYQHLRQRDQKRLDTQQSYQMPVARSPSKARQSWRQWLTSCLASCACVWLGAYLITAHDLYQLLLAPLDAAWR